MPIRFRCSYCNRLLGIATRKAGTQTRCPHCGHEITVPVPAGDESKTERITFDDVEQMLGRGGTEVLAEPAAALAPPIAPGAPVGEKPHPEPRRLPETPPPKSAPKSPSPGPAGAPKAHAVPAIPKEHPKPTESGDRPLFEGDVDELLGTPRAPEEPDRAKPPAVSGMDALSLGEPARHIVLSAQTATLLVVAVVVLMAVAFAVGYFLAPKG